MALQLLLVVWIYWYDPTQASNVTIAPKDGVTGTTSTCGVAKRHRRVHGPRRWRRRAAQRRLPGVGGRPTAAASRSLVVGDEPRAFWRHFEAVTKIPRPSRGEEPVIRHVRLWAGENGLGLREDRAGNLVIEVPATAGRQSAPVLVLQGHLDMVCERDPDSQSTLAVA